MTYLVIFVLNVATLEPVILKDCIEYHPKTEQTIEGYVKDMERSGQVCEQSKGMESWTCTDNKSIITKLALIKDREECRTLPREAADKMKKILGR